MPEIHSGSPIAGQSPRQGKNQSRHRIGWHWKTGWRPLPGDGASAPGKPPAPVVITSYSIHYTKLYEKVPCLRPFWLSLTPLRREESIPLLSPAGPAQLAPFPAISCLSPPLKPHWLPAPFSFRSRMATVNFFNNYWQPLTTSPCPAKICVVSYNFV